MNNELDAYNELENIGVKALNEFGVSLFEDLPLEKQKQLLVVQEQVFSKYRVSKDNFLKSSLFIALD